MLRGMIYDKVHVNLLRRAAARQGLVLHRSRRRDPRALDYGLYWLKDGTGTAVAASAGASLDEIEAYLAAGTPERSRGHIGGVTELTREEGRVMLGERTSRELGLTLEEFEAAYDAGTLDTGLPGVTGLIMLLPFAR